MGFFRRKIYMCCEAIFLAVRDLRAVRREGREEINTFRELLI